MENLLTNPTAATTVVREDFLGEWMAHLFLWQPNFQNEPAAPLRAAPWEGSTMALCSMSWFQAFIYTKGTGALLRHVSQEASYSGESFSHCFSLRTGQSWQPWKLVCFGNVMSLFDLLSMRTSQIHFHCRGSQPGGGHPSPCHMSDYLYYDS